MFSHFPNIKILDSSKQKEFADDDSKFDENDKKISEQVENTVGKREIAHYEQLLLFPQHFEEFVLQTCKNKGLFIGNGLKEEIQIT